MVYYLDEGIALFRHRAGFQLHGDDDVFENIADSWVEE